MAQRRIILVVYDGFELLDLSGPASVFECANYASGTPAYTQVAASVDGGLVSPACGFAIDTRALKTLSIGITDTVLVVGAPQAATRRAMADARLARWLVRADRAAGRIGSVCSGALVLAAAGLLDHKKATTHWQACQAMADQFPLVDVLGDELYVADGNTWTSAGVTAGIDMALALVEADLGARLSSQIAKQLVVYAYRPGYQSQFSEVLDAQVAAEGAFADLIGWLQNNFSQPLRVEDMAARAGLSERTFYRRFTAAVGVSPSKFLDDMRLHHAKNLLEARTPVGAVAAAVGYRSEAGFREAFRQRYGISPSHHLSMHKG